MSLTFLLGPWLGGTVFPKTVALPKSQSLSTGGVEPILKRSRLPEWRSPWTIGDGRVCRYKRPRPASRAKDNTSKGTSVNNLLLKRYPRVTPLAYSWTIHGDWPSCSSNVAWHRTTFGWSSWEMISLSRLKALKSSGLVERGSFTTTSMSRTFPLITFPLAPLHSSLTSFIRTSQRWTSGLRTLTSSAVLFA